MSQAKAVSLDPTERQPSLAAPLGETPVARPGFSHAVSWLLVLSVPLWALIIGGGYLVARVIG
jgi:hypothetical protein